MDTSTSSGYDTQNQVRKPRKKRGQEFNEPRLSGRLAPFQEQYDQARRFKPDGQRRDFNDPVPSGRWALMQPATSQQESNQPRQLLPDPMPQMGSSQPRTSSPPSSPVAQMAGNFARTIGEMGARAMGVQDNSPQANFMRASADGTLDDAAIAQAHDFARSIGTTFNPQTGYDRSPFMESRASTSGKSYNATALPSPSSQPENKKKSPVNTAKKAEDSQDIEGAKIYEPDALKKKKKKPGTVKYPDLKF